MKSRQFRKGVIFRTILEPDGTADPEADELDAREWADPLAPVREDVQRWSTWLRARSLPVWGVIAVSEHGAWRAIGTDGLLPGEICRTAHTYLRSRFGGGSTEELAAQAVSSFMGTAASRAGLQSGGYAVPHQPEDGFRLACAVQLGRLLAELDLRAAPSRTGGRRYKLEEDLERAEEQREHQRRGGEERAKNASPEMDEAADDVRQLRREGKGLRQACEIVAKRRGLNKHTIRGHELKTPPPEKPD